MPFILHEPNIGLARLLARLRLWIVVTQIIRHISRTRSLDFFDNNPVYESLDSNPPKHSKVIHIKIFRVMKKFKSKLPDWAFTQTIQRRAKIFVIFCGIVHWSSVKENGFVSTAAKKTQWRQDKIVHLTQHPTRQTL